MFHNALPRRKILPDKSSWHLQIDHKMMKTADNLTNNTYTKMITTSRHQEKSEGMRKGEDMVINWAGK